MNQEIKYEGKTYYKRNGRWYDKQTNCETTYNIQSKLNRIYNEKINYSNLDYHEIIKIADGYNISKSYLMAIKAYEIAIKKTVEVKEIRYILPRITSCYRKNNQSNQAIKLYTNISKEYGSNILDGALLTSIAAAYIDIQEYEKAKKCANKAFEMLNKNCSYELNMVYKRLKKYME